MILDFLRKLIGHKRVSTKLTPRYSDRRAKELRKAREWFVEHNQVRA